MQTQFKPLADIPPSDFSSMVFCKYDVQTTTKAPFQIKSIVEQWLENGKLWLNY